jgi:OmpA-OmpF porin, OOP family
MTLRTKLLAATLLAAPLFALPHGAKAQPVTGLYVGLGAGANILMDEEPGFGRHFDFGSRYHFDTGAVGVGSIGWGFGNGFRAELEGDYRYNSVDRIGGSSRFVSGLDQQNYGAMANLLFDLDVRSPYIFPYFGVGAGWTQTRLSYEGGVTNDNFAYQGIFGLSFPVPWVVGLSATAEYRFFGVPNPGGFKLAPGVKLDVNQDLNHSFLIGLRYAFNTAPPPPPPAPPVVVAPAPAPARSYLVFFDWDRADLTDRARQVVAEAARNASRVQVTRIEVNGYTDTSGTPQYNQGLSVRRAQTVQAELVRDGVPANEIEIHGYGETHLLVPTAQGVREPQNRRVEIILR